MDLGGGGQDAESAGGSSATTSAPRYDVLAMLAPTSGIDDLARILRALPAGLPVTVLVVQHLPEQGRALASILRRRVRLPVAWAAEGAELGVGQVLLCPPQSALVVLPDRTLSILSGVRPQDRPGDMLLESLAETGGGSGPGAESATGRTLAVTLAGVGRDGAAGARALSAAGGTVIAERDPAPGADGAARSVPAATSADLFFHLEEMGERLREILATGEPPLVGEDESAAADMVLVGDGDEDHASKRMRTLDWSASRLGPIVSWPPSLAAAVRSMLDSPVATILCWGPDLVVLPNDAAIRLFGAGLTRATGKPLHEVHNGGWAARELAHRSVMRSGRPETFQAETITVDAPDGRREAHVATTLAALRDDQGALAGTVATTADATGLVIEANQLSLLRRIQAEASEAGTVAEACAQAFKAVATDPELVPFALAYLVDGSRAHAQLRAHTGLAPGGPGAPVTVSLPGSLVQADGPWPLGTVAMRGATVLVEDIAGSLPDWAAGPYAEPPPAALTLPLRLGTDQRPAGVLVIGASAHRALDPAHRHFLDAVGAEVVAAATAARARQGERDRIEAITETERAKTRLLADFSHELRAPLTMLLAHLEEVLDRGAELPEGIRDDFEVAHRSARRIARMVDSLLELSLVETGRRRALFAPTDLAALTRDVAAMFAGVVDRAGLELVVDCPPLPEQIWIDPSMWEHIVANLLSNAVKFTLVGRITVRLRMLPSYAELSVSDTGAGIPENALAHVFRRFHRVEGTEARAHDGTGIGLALVHDLARLHQGRARAQSRPGEGSTFTVWVPRGRRLSSRESEDEREPIGAISTAHADETLSWIEATVPEGEGDDRIPPRGPCARVLVVEDNADMRDFLRRLLGRHWNVDVVNDGTEALARIATDPPDAVVADLVVVAEDGLAMVREIRRDSVLRSVPVVLLSGHAGVDAAVAGLEAGADDYMVKPFAPRELVARVGAQIEISRRRHEAEGEGGPG